MRKMIVMVLISLLFLSAGAQINNPRHRYELRGVIETGAIGVEVHHIKFGREGTSFDYVKNGSQNILFPFERYSLELHLMPRHTFIGLYQPLDLRTAATLTDTLVLDTDTFLPGTPMNLRYGFDFYRVSWLYDLWALAERELAIGLSLQLRNASIVFATADGERQRVYQNLGPVPIVKARLKLPLNNWLWFGSEIDGFYAQGAGVTGSTNVENSFKGAILDGSVRLGARVNNFLDGFVNLRYIGGGAEGTQKKPQNPGDGYTSNWLSTLSFSLGIMMH
ncbi:MAG: hypothetical protein ABIK47_01005 [candidate division WOR-3 bacterium]